MNLRKHMKEMLKTAIAILTMLTSDILVLVVAFALAIGVRNIIGIYITIPDLTTQDFWTYVLANWWIIPLYISIFVFQGLYHKHRPFWQETRILVNAIALSALFVYSIISLGKIDIYISRILFVLHPLILFGMLPLARRFIKAILYQLGYWRKEVIEIQVDTTHSLTDSFLRNRFIGYHITQSIRVSIKDEEVSEIVAKVKEATKKYRTETILVVVKDFASPKIAELVERLYFVSSHILVVPELMDLDVMNADVYHLMYENLFVFDIDKGLNNPLNKFLKRLMDIVLSLIGIVLASPILLFEALLVYIKDGAPIFYDHERYGRGGNIFIFHKFRSMRKEAYKNENDDILWKYLAENPEIKKKEWDKYQKLEHDPRVLPGMNLIRKTSIDELAQLFNVLKGDMSIVGPRPFMPREREIIGDYFERVLAAKPGITDLWTVSGRDALSFDQRLKMSTWYIQNWSIWLDIVIIAKTVQQVILYFLKWFKKSKKISTNM